MRVITVAELRQGLSEALHAAEAGEQLVVTRHGRPVAILGPVSAASALTGDAAGSEMAAESRAAYVSAANRAATQQVTTFTGGAGDRLFASRGTRRVLSLFVLHPGREFYQREVARLAGVSLRSAQLALGRLVSLGLVDARSSGNRMHYVSVPSAAFDALRGWAIPEVALVPVLREALEPLGDAIEMAFVYGSTASGEDTATSDIDLMVVGEVDSYALYDATQRLHERFGRVVNITHYDAAEFREKMASGSHFIMTVMRAPVLWVLGEDRLTRP